MYFVPCRKSGSESIAQLTVLGKNDVDNVIKWLYKHFKRDFQKLGKSKISALMDFQRMTFKYGLMLIRNIPKRYQLFSTICSLGEEPVKLLKKVTGQHFWLTFIFAGNHQWAKNYFHTPTWLCEDQALQIMRICLDVSLD